MSLSFFSLGMANLNILKYIHRYIVMLPCANYTSTSKGESCCFSACKLPHWHWLTLTAWLLGSWSLLRWVLSYFSCPASGVSLWQYLISHPWVSAPHPRPLPGTEAKINSPAPAEAEPAAEELAKLHFDLKSVCAVALALQSSSRNTEQVSGKHSHVGED